MAPGYSSLPAEDWANRQITQCSNDDVDMVVAGHIRTPFDPSFESFFRFFVVTPIRAENPRRQHPGLDVARPGLLFYEAVVFDSLVAECGIGHAADRIHHKAIGRPIEPFGGSVIVQALV